MSDIYADAPDADPGKPPHQVLRDRLSPVADEAAFYDGAGSHGIQVGFFLGLVMFVSLLGWAGSRRESKWFWFWMIGAPLFTGVLAYALLELIRPRPGPRRLRSYSGLTGFAGASLALPLLFVVLDLGLAAVAGFGFTS